MQVRVMNLEESVEHLMEGHRAGETGYHFTNFDGFAKIMNTDMLLATNDAVSSANHGWKANYSDDTNKSWSYTRKKDGMYYRNMNLPDAVRLTLDIDKISNNHKVFPFSWDNIAKNDRNFEFEDRVVGHTWTDSSGKKVTGTKNITKYIKEVALSYLLTSSEILLKVDKNTEICIDTLESFEYSLEHAEALIKKINDIITDNKKIKLLLHDKAKLTKFLIDEFKKNNEDFSKFYKHIETIYDDTKQVNGIGYYMYQLKDSLKINSKGILFDVQALTSLQYDKKTFKTNSTLKKKHQKNFMTMLSRIKDFKFSNDMYNKDFSEVLEAFEQYLQSKGIRFSLQKLNLNHIGADTVKSGIPKSVMDKFILSIRERAQKALKFHEELMKEYEKLLPYIKDYDNTNITYKEVTFPSEISEILKNIFKGIQKRNLNKFINQINLKSLNLYIIYRSVKSMYYSNTELNDASLAVARTSDKVSRILDRLNKDLKVKRYKWKLVTDISKNMYKFGGKFFRLLQALHVNDNQIKGNKLAQYLLTCMEHDNTDIDIGLTISTDKESFDVIIEKSPEFKDTLECKIKYGVVVQ